jgi:hypothetical protein
MDPEGDLAEFIECARQTVDDVGQRPAVLFELLRHRRLRRPQLERQRDELLLRPVVQVTLDPAPRCVGRRDDARARGLELGTRVWMVSYSSVPATTVPITPPSAAAVAIWTKDNRPRPSRPPMKVVNVTGATAAPMSSSDGT